MNQVLVLCAVASLTVVVIGAPVAAQPTSPPAGNAAASQDGGQSLAEQRYALFATVAEELELTLLRSGQRLQLQKQPLQTFSSDGHTFGSVALWKAPDGRPGAIGTLGSLPIRGTEFGFIELHWLLDEPMKPVTIAKANPMLWRADGEGVSSTRIEGELPPAETAPARLIQMRNLARAFSAGMTHGTNREQLRLLPQPLYRYGDNSPGKDGAIFAFVWTIGTDPEVLLHLHSREHDGDLSWYWQPIRFTWRAVDLTYKNTKVWAVDEFIERDQRVQTGPYLTTLTAPIE